MNAKVFSAALAISLGLAVVTQAADEPANAAAQPNNNVDLQFNGNPQAANNGRAGRGAARELLGARVGSFAPFSNSDYGSFDYGYGRGSTAGGDFLRGRAQVISATGEAVKDVSEALVNREVARDLAIDNNYKFVESYWETRRLWKNERNYERGQPLSSDQLAQIARDAAPERLNVRELNPTTHEIKWPAALQRPEFAPLRALVQDQFDARNVSNTGLGSETEAAVTNLAKAMQSELKVQIPTMTTNEYVVAKSFLRSLPYETRFMPAVQGIASR